MLKALQEIAKLFTEADDDEDVLYDNFSRKGLEKFTREHLKMKKMHLEVVPIKPLPNSVELQCYGNVLTFCDKVKIAEPVLCWGIDRKYNIFRANLHAIIRYRGTYRDITPQEIKREFITVIIDHRLSVKDVLLEAIRFNGTFYDILDKPFGDQGRGIDFFDVLQKMSSKVNAAQKKSVSKKVASAKKSKNN